MLFSLLPLFALLHMLLVFLVVVLVVAAILKITTLLFVFVCSLDLIWRSNMFWCLDVEPCFEAYVLCFWGSYFFEGVGCQMFADLQILMHILEPTSIIFVGFAFFEGVGGHIYDDVKYLRHILKLKCYILVDFGFLEVYEVKCVLMLNSWSIFWSISLIMWEVTWRLTYVDNIKGINANEATQVQSPILKVITWSIWYCVYFVFHKLFKNQLVIYYHVSPNNNQEYQFIHPITQQQPSIPIHPTNQPPNKTLHHDSHRYPTQQQSNTNLATPTIYPTSTNNTHDAINIHQITPKIHPTPTE